MKHLTITAAPPSAVDAGHVVLHVSGLTAVDRYRLRSVGPELLREPYWPSGWKTPVDVRAIAGGVDLKIGPDVAEHTGLQPGVAVVIEFGDKNASGEFLWPTVVPMPRQKRQRLAQRIGVVLPLDTPSPPAPRPAQVAEPVSSPVTATVAIPPPTAQADVAPPLPSPARVDTVPPDDAPWTMAAVDEGTRATELPPVEPVAVLKPIVRQADMPGVQAQLPLPDAIAEPRAEPLIVAPALPARPAGDKIRVATLPAVRPARPPDRIAAPVLATPPRKDEPKALAATTSSASEVTSSASEPAPQQPPAQPTLVPAPAHTDNTPATATVRRAPRIPLLPLAAGFATIVAVGAGYLHWQRSDVSVNMRTDIFAGARANNTGPRFNDARRAPPGASIDAPAVAIAAPATPPAAAIVQPVPAPPAPRPVEMASIAAAPPPHTCPAPEVRTTSLPGGLMALNIRSTCLRDEDAVLTYGTYSTILRFDADGSLNQIVDCIFGTAPLSVRLPAQPVISVSPQCGDLDRVSKVAVIWRGPVNLDLHAFERLTPPGERGQVSAGAPRTVETARKLADAERGPRGFLSSRADARGHGQRIEVYTVFHGVRAQSIPLALDFETRGTTPSGAFCGDGAQAEVTYEVVRLAPGASISQASGRIERAVCGATQPAPVRFRQNALPPLRVPALERR